MEITNLTMQKVDIAPPDNGVEEIEEIEEVEEYTGPTADDLRREAEEFKTAWEQEKATMISAAQAEADEIIKNSEKVAFERVKSENEEAQKIRERAQEEAEKILEEARLKSQKAEEDTNSRLAKIEEEASEKGFAKGYEKGYQEGQGEVERLIGRIRVIVNKIIERRNDIIEGAETQIINLVLLVAKKVIKVISENQKNVVINNVLQGLRKLKTRGDVIVRVNMADLKITSERVQDFLKQVENVSAISVMEDTTVDKGGCIIETDFGQVDARISSQLNEIEEKIVELMPIKTRVEG